MRLRDLLGLMAGLGIGLTAAAPAHAQAGAASLAAACAAGAEGALVERCADAALAAYALTGGLGLLASAGGAVPVSPSTAGHRLEGSPRIVVDAGANFASFHLPDPTRDPAGAVDRRASFVAGRITVGAGVFEGFSPAATVGGVGSLDGVVSLRVLRLPSGAGFSGSVASLGGGVRVGVFRESFSLPGVTFTAMHHRVGTVRYGELDAHGVRAAVQPRVTSLRLEAGKDLLALGVTGGVGWDRTTSSSRISARAEGIEGGAGPERIRENRRHLFLGVNHTWLVTQLAGELTWAPGRSHGEPLTGTGPYEAGRGSLQGAVTFRVLY